MPKGIPLEITATIVQLQLKLEGYGWLWLKIGKASVPTTLAIFPI